jgi:manganese/zinc/iron transport system permease protein
MSAPQLEIQLIASLVAMACAIPGVFLTLRKMAMISDAISHAILPGIVVGFLITNSINSPLLIVLAALTGLLTVVFVELLNKTKLLKEDAAIGLVFPFLFSIGVVIISRNASNIHIDTDAVLMGELAFAPFNRLSIAGIDFGPVSAWTAGIVLVVNLMFVILFFKELKISTFDAALAAALGFVPATINYILLGLVSATAVVAFDSVGAILVVALMIAPGATAYLLTTNLKRMIIYSALIGIFSAIAGYWTANLLNTSIAGAIATSCGVIFLTAFLFAPQTGLISIVFHKIRQKDEFAQMTFLLHIYNHSDENDDINERRLEHLHEHLLWSNSYSRKILDQSIRKGLVVSENNIISITLKGRQFVEAANRLITGKYDPGFDALRDEFILFSD